MKHLLNGVAFAAALAIAGPLWAQQQPPQSPYNPAVNPNANSMGVPGANPGGPTPYNSITNAAPPPAMTSANPPPHPVAHTRAMHHFHKAMASKAALTGDTTAQLNREELARINSGNLSNPPAAAPMPEGGQAPPPYTGSSSRLPVGGPKIQ
jgi:hypothetical protein